MKNEYKKEWLVIEGSDCVIVFPEHDSGPHGEKINDEEYDINTILCECRPTIEYKKEYTKKLVIHNAWDGREWDELARKNK